MAITTTSAMVSKMRPPQQILKVGAVNATANFLWTNSMAPGSPGAYTPIATISGGTAMTTGYTNSPFWENPSSGNTYISRLENTMTQIGTVYVYDKLWFTSTVNPLVTTVQTINSVPFPARDVNMSVSGEGLTMGFEVTTLMGAGSPSMKVTYTNSNGVSGRTTVFSPGNGHTVGTIVPVPLMSGDTGFAQINFVEFTVAYASGAFALCAYRKLMTLDCPRANNTFSVDGVMGGFPIVYNDSAIQLAFLVATTASLVSTTNLTYSQG